MIVHQILNVLKHFRTVDFSTDGVFGDSNIGLPSGQSLLNPRNIRIDPDTLEVTIMNISFGPVSSLCHQNSNGEPPFSPTLDKENRDDLWNLGYILSKMCKAETDTCKDFIFGCKSKDPKEKLSLDQALNHEFLRFRNSTDFAIRLDPTGIDRLSSISNSVSSPSDSFLSL